MDWDNNQVRWINVHGVGNNQMQRISSSIRIYGTHIDNA